MNYDHFNAKGFDPDFMRGILPGAAMEHRLLGPASLLASCRRLEIAGCSLTAANYSFPVLINGSFPGDGLHFGFRTGLVDTIHVNGLTLPRERLLLYPRGYELHYVAQAGEEWIDIAVPEESLATAFAELHGCDLEWPVQGVRSLEISPFVTKRLRYEIEELLSAGVSGDREASCTGMDGTLGAGLIRMLARIIGHAPFKNRPRSLSPGQIVGIRELNRTLANWIKKASGPIGPAQVQGVHPRVLEQAVRLVYGITPHRWIKIARLNCAYRDLLRGRYKTVTDVAQAWRFTHYGRFSGEFRDLFGETPSQLLDRAHSSSLRSGEEM